MKSFDFFPAIKNVKNHCELEHCTKTKNKKQTKKVVGWILPANSLLWKMSATTLYSLINRNISPSWTLPFLH
jgi:hypothetical protein